MGADAGEGAIGGSLDQLDGRIFFAQPGGYFVDVFDSAISSPAASQPWGIDVHTDITVTDRHGIRRRFLFRTSFKNGSTTLMSLMRRGLIFANMSSLFFAGSSCFGYEAALFNSENAVVDEIIGVELSDMGTFAHLIQSNLCAPIAVGMT
jgi:hypothetical protein